MDADTKYRQAFERLTNGKPLLMPEGSRVSQNNVAKEAGSDPSAFRKSRYPSLISEIQTWIKINGDKAPPSKRKKSLLQRKKNRERKDREGELIVQRDQLHSKLLEVSVLVLEQAASIADLESRLAQYEPKAHVTPLMRDEKGARRSRVQSKPLAP